MSIMKKLFIALLSIFMLTNLVACGKETGEKTPDEAIPVLSNHLNIEYIVPGEYDTSKIDDPTCAKYSHQTYVAEVNGKLALIPAHVDGSSIGPYIAKTTCYKFGNIVGGENGVFLNEKIIIPQKCIGMVHSYDLDTLLIFTTTDNTGTVYFLTRENEKEEYSLTDNKMQIEGKIYLVYYDFKSMEYDAPSQIYLISSKGVSILHTDAYLNNGSSDFTSIKVDHLKTPDLWSYISPTNATQTDEGTIWIGEREGVIGIHPDGSIKYYPIDYLNAIQEKRT